jgi:hypothetical protein
VRSIDLYSVLISRSGGSYVTIKARTVILKADGVLEVRGIKGPTTIEGGWERFEVTRLSSRAEEV